MFGPQSIVETLHRLPLSRSLERLFIVLIDASLVPTHGELTFISVSGYNKLSY